MSDLNEIGALTMEQVRRHANVQSDGRYWRCSCGRPIASDYRGSREPTGEHEEHRDEEIGKFVERIAKDYARRLGCPS
jgi:hypothetical protein